MKTNYFFKTLLVAVVLLVATASVSAITVTHTITDGAGADLPSGSIDANISYFTEKNDAGTPPRHYTQIRLYYAANGNGGSLTLIPVEGFVINEVKITAVNKYTPPMLCNVDGERDVAAVLDGITYTISDIAATKSLRIRNGTVPNVQMRVQAIEVTYEAIDPSAPSILLAEALIPEMMAKVTTSATKTLMVNATNLTADVTVAITGDDAAYFTASPATISPIGGSLTNVALLITYTPPVARAYSAMLTLSSPGATNVTRTLVGGIIPDQITPPDVIITEVYGGGGNAGAKYRYDFIELYNTTANAVDISGWGVQYYAANELDTARVFNRAEIPVGKTIPANGYFLIQATAGTSYPAPDDSIHMPAPDVISTLGLAAGAGKVVLYTSDDRHVITSDIASITSNPSFKDYVPYGLIDIDPLWGTLMGANLSNTLSAQRVRIDGNYSYTQNIGYDFEVGEPDPQNSLVVSVRTPQLSLDVVAINGTIGFNAVGGQTIEIYSVTGQKLVTKLANDGYNMIPLKEKGMMIVKVGNKVSKVIL